MAAEGVICELKIGSGRKVTKMKWPKLIWFYCLELEAYIHSNKALDIFDMAVMNPKTKMSG